MQIVYVWSAALQTGQTVGTEAYLVHGVVAIFAVALFSLSLYAWSRRRHIGVLIVSSAFLLFAVKEAVWIIYQIYNSYSSSIDLALTLLDLVVLGLFFAAITFRPRKQLE